LNHNDLIIQNKYGDTPLHNACSNGYLEIVKELLLRLNHDDLIIKDRYYSTPLHIACEYKHKEIMKLLILNGLPNGEPIIDYQEYNAYMKSIKWSRNEHKNVMHKQTRLNILLICMVYKGHEMREKLQ
jgi:ankyrin repeat protein